MDKQYVKLSELVDGDFEIFKVLGYQFQKWDNDNKKMLTDSQWFEGARKVYQLETDKGQLNLSESQLGMIMVKVQHAGKADVVGVTVGVKSNGKTGIDIRYWLNPTKIAKPRPEAPSEATEQLDNDFMGQIPF